jgi:hypothetical protein
MENVKNSVFLDSLGCPRRGNGIGWGVVIFLTLGCALIGAVPSDATIKGRVAVPRSLGSLRSINVNIAKANLYTTTTNLSLNMVNNLQNANISGSSVGNGVLNARSASPFANQSSGSI